MEETVGLTNSTLPCPANGSHITASSEDQHSSLTHTVPLLLAQNEHHPPPMLSVLEPMPELSWQIIPEEDSQHHVEIRDEEKEDVGVARDGIGEEDDDEEGADELDDGAGQGGHVPRPCRPRPDWLLKAFKVCVAQADPACQNVNWLPLFYAELQSFWFPQKSNFFLLPKTSPPLLNNPCFFCGIPKLCVMKFHAQIAGSHCNTCTCPKSPPLH